MEIHHTFILGCFLVLLAITCSSGADVKEKENVKAGLEVKSPVILDQKNNTNEKLGGKESGLNPVKKGKDQVDGSKNGTKNDADKNNTSKQVEKKKDHSINKGGLSDNTQGKDNGKQEKDGKVVEPEPNKESGKGNSGDSTPKRTENNQGEECDMSNSCKIEKTKLVACLRVPGNDSPDLSLLIQNKGKGMLTVVISVPDYVQLESKKVEVKQNENRKVRVSIGSGGTDNSIVLSTGNEHCSLDFRDLIGHSANDETNTAPKSGYSIFLTQTSSIVFVSLAALIMIGSACAWVRFRKGRSVGSDAKYQKLDSELSVPSGGVKTEAEINDGWDNSWDDDWDDEEAPKTPSMPVTPSVSSKGLSSRRLNKDGWKD